MARDPRGMRTCHPLLAPLRCLGDRPLNPRCRASLRGCSKVRPPAPLWKRNPPRRLAGTVVQRRRTGRHRFSMLRAFLVDDARRDLLGQRLGLAALDEAVLDVRVLALALCASVLLWHVPSLADCGVSADELACSWRIHGPPQDAHWQRAISTRRPHFGRGRGAFSGRRSRRRREQ